MKKLLLVLLPFIIFFSPITINAANLTNGWYTIQPKKSSVLRLGVLDTKNGSDIKLFNAANKSGQKFMFQKQADGTWKIGTGTTVGMSVLATGSKQQKYTSSDKKQKWTIVENSDSSYQLINASTGKALQYSSLTDKGNIVEATKSTADTQKFLIKPFVDTFTVTFNSGTGQVLKRQLIKSGNSVTAPANPTRTGYSFDGWDKTFNKITSNTIITAKWKPVSYTITYALDGGTNNSANPKTYTIESNTITLKAPTKTGYTFSGWKEGSSIAKGSTGNKTFTAKWIPKTAKVIFNKNDGSTTTYTETYTYDKASQSFGMNKKGVFDAWTRTGYDLIGWAIDKNATTKNWGITSGVSNNWINKYTGTINLYAVWVPKAYTVTFNGNGSTGGSTTALSNKNYNTSVTLTANGFTRTGYTFTGWNTKADGKGTTYTNKASFKIPAANTTLYAQWRPNVLTINYYAGTATGDSKGVWTNTSNKLMKTVKYNYNGKEFKDYGLPNTNGGTWILTRTGYYPTNYFLVGSATSTKKINCDTPFSTNQDLAKAAGVDLSTSDKTINLYAEMSIKSVKAVFHSENVNGLTRSEIYTYGKSGQSFGMTFGTKTGDFGTWHKWGYTLKGWALTKNATEIKYIPYNLVGDGWIDLYGGNNKVVDLYPVWSKKYNFTNVSTNQVIRILKKEDERVVRTGGKVDKTVDYSIPWIVAAASPEIVKYKGKIFCYFRGEAGNKDTTAAGSALNSLIFVYQPKSAGDILKWDKDTVNTKKVKGVQSYTDETNGINSHTTDFTAVVYKDKIYMFYKYKQPKSDDWTLRYATSTDGINFADQGELKGLQDSKGKPYACVVAAHVVDDRLYLIFRGDNVLRPDLVISYSDDDCKTFSSPKPILTHYDQTGATNLYGEGVTPATSTVLRSIKFANGKTGQEKQGFNTPETFDDGEYLYVIYAMCFDMDWNDGMGIARCSLSKDLTDIKNWEPYPYNPIMIRGSIGDTDEGSIWTPFVYNDENGTVYLYYEGAGRMRENATDDGPWVRNHVHEIRRFAYTFYRKNYDGVYSNIMIGRFNTNDLKTAWNKTPINNVNKKIKSQYTVNGNYSYIAVNNNTLTITNDKTKAATFKINYSYNFHHIYYNNLPIRPEVEDSNIVELYRTAYNNMSKKPILGIPDDIYIYKWNSNIVTKNVNATDWQSKLGEEWHLTPESDGSYTIQNRATGRYLGLVNGQLKQVQLNNTKNIRWVFE